MNKQLFKMRWKCCAVCGEDNYALLDTHRIVEGREYSEGNCIALCCKCHRMHHVGQITIKEKRFTTNGYVLIYEQNGKEIIIEL